MQLHSVLTVARHELRLLRRNTFVFVVLIAMPMVLIAFVRPLFDGIVEEQGYADANGSAYAVPGMSVMFAFLFMGNVAVAFFREFQWRTWDRLGTSGLSVTEIIIGKSLPLFGVVCVQQLLVLSIASPLVGLRVRGSLLALIPTAVMFSACVVALGVAAVAVCRTIQQLDLLSTVGMLVMSGLGGALTPVSLLPDALQALSPATPSYWTLRAYRSVILDGEGLAGTVLPLVVLAGFITALIVVSRVRFDIDRARLAVA